MCDATPSLDCLADEAHAIHGVEDVIEHADAIARRIFGLARPYQSRLHEAIERADQSRAKRALDVAEQDDPRDVAAVLGDVNECFVEHHRLAVAPRVRLAVEDDPAQVRVRRDEAEVITQRARERVAVRAELRTGWQQREHRRVDAGYRLDELGGPWAQ